MFLLHGAEDNVIPSVDTVLLTNHLRGKTEVHAVLSGLITHAEVDKVVPPPSRCGAWSASGGN